MTCRRHCAEAMEWMEQLPHPLLTLISEANPPERGEHAILVPAPELIAAATTAVVAAAAPAVAIAAAAPTMVIAAAAPAMPTTAATAAAAPAMPTTAAAATAASAVAAAGLEEEIGLRRCRKHHRCQPAGCHRCSPRQKHTSRRIRLAAYARGGSDDGI